MANAPLKSFEEFCKAIGQRESSGNYQAKNWLGYLGCYQFGMARLCDLGLTRRKPGEPLLMDNEAFEWKPPYSESLFLDTPALQDETFVRHIQLLRRTIISSIYVDLRACLPPSMSGAIAVCHLLGFKGFMDFWLHGINGTDANGTSASEYYKSFTGYEIPQARQDSNLR